VDKKIVMTPAVRDALVAEEATIEEVRIPAAQQALASISAEVDQEDRADEDLEEQLEVLLRRQVEIREALTNGEVVAKPATNEAVGIGSKVTVQDGGTHQTYAIVGTIGADSERGWITTASPLGAALLGRHKGETVTLDAPDGQRSVTVVAIE
jgi:transcription elongation GreA/GreB family factor